MLKKGLILLSLLLSSSLRAGYSTINNSPDPFDIASTYCKQDVFECSISDALSSFKPDGTEDDKQENKDRLSSMKKATVHLKVTHKKIGSVFCSGSVLNVTNGTKTCKLLLTAGHCTIKKHKLKKVYAYNPNKKTKLSLSLKAIKRSKETCIKTEAGGESCLIQDNEEKKLIKPSFH